MTSPTEIYVYKEYSFYNTEADLFLTSQHKLRSIAVLSITNHKDTLLTCIEGEILLLAQAIRKNAGNDVFHYDHMVLSFNRYGISKFVMVETYVTREDQKILRTEFNWENTIYVPELCYE